MRFFVHCLFLPLFLAALTLLTGCATNAPQNLFTATGAGWKVQQGQALWTPRTGAPQFGGDLIVVTDERGRALVQFDKTPLTIVTAQTTTGRWLLNFPQGGGLWTGKQPAPTRTVWPYLANALAGKPVPKPLEFNQEANGNWRLANPKTGEALEGYLSP